MQEVSTLTLAGFICISMCVHFYVSIFSLNTKGKTSHPICINASRSGDASSLP